MLRDLVGAAAFGVGGGGGKGAGKGRVIPVELSELLLLLPESEATSLWKFIEGMEGPSWEDEEGCAE
jgi:hypothetical protein